MKLKLIISVPVLLASLILYAFLGGAWEILAVKHLQNNLRYKLVSKSNNMQHALEQDQDVIALMLLMRERLAKNPYDTTGWKLLSKVYTSIGDERNAELAQQKANFSV